MKRILQAIQAAALVVIAAALTVVAIQLSEPAPTDTAAAIKATTEAVRALSCNVNAIARGAPNPGSLEQQIDQENAGLSPARTFARDCAP